MKKFLMFLCALTLVFGMVGTASAITFSDTQTLNKLLWGSGTETWTHNTPDDFGIPPDVVNSATLTISAFVLIDSDAIVEVQRTGMGILSGGAWSWSWWGGGGSTDFDIADVFVNWIAGAPLTVDLNYGPTLIGLGSSTFTLDYENVDVAIPQPEPATILLMGSGLLGLVAYGRKRYNKKV